jgi:hypothetical protein
MINSAERLRVLKMIEEGSISAAEGARLLTADGGSGPEGGLGAAAGQTPRWIRVLVTDTNTGKARVNVKLPVNLLSTGVKMGAHLAIDVEGLDIQQINDYVKRGVTGQVMEVVDDDDCEKVEIFLE